MGPIGSATKLAAAQIPTALGRSSSLDSTASAETAITITPAPASSISARAPRNAPAVVERRSSSALTAYSAKGLSTWTPASSKSLMLRVTTVIPCTRAVAAMSASITGRGCAYC